RLVACLGFSTTHKVFPILPIFPGRWCGEPVARNLHDLLGNYSLAKEFIMVLSRKPGETFVIDDRVRVTVLDVLDGKLQCRIEPRAGLTVQREESPPEIREIMEMEYGVGD